MNVINEFINFEYLSRSDGSRCKAESQSVQAVTYSTEFYINFPALYSEHWISVKKIAIGPFIR